jgi:hypothetical protein
MEKQKRMYCRNFPPGYGEFPYFILRVRWGIYLQVPVSKLKIQLPGKKDIYCVVFSQTLISSVRDIRPGARGVYTGSLSEIAEQIREDVSLRFCLVKSPECADYYENGTIIPDKGIPAGGWLLDMEMNHIDDCWLHYKEVGEGRWN